ncbi:acyltransferase [Bacillus sp. EB93]|nr:acyltransferase [Peribacillus frigoritolerans]
MIKKVLMYTEKNIKVITRDLTVNKIASSVLCVRSIRYLIYKIYGIKTRTRNIAPRCFFGGRNVVIGRECFINYGCFFENSDLIEIGNSCSIGMEVMFCNATHEIGNTSNRAGKYYGKPIRVGDGCWIGTRAIIMPGVTIGEGCIIAAGAVVTKDCEPNGLYAGVPAKRIKELPLSKNEKRVG